MTNTHTFKKVEYNKLNSRQKENYNYQKVSSVLADYGFNTIRLSDDWQGADFIAIHINGKDFLKVQLKGRLTFDKKYIGRDIWISFCYKESWFIYQHDSLLEELKMVINFTNTNSWIKKNGYSWNHLSRQHLNIISKYKI